MSLIGFAPVNIAVKEKWMWTLIIWIYLIISVYKLLYDRTTYDRRIDKILFTSKINRTKFKIWIIEKKKKKGHVDQIEIY